MKQANSHLNLSNTAALESQLFLQLSRAVNGLLMQLFNCSIVVGIGCCGALSMPFVVISMKTMATA